MLGSFLASLLLSSSPATDINIKHNFGDNSGQAVVTEGVIEQNNRTPLSSLSAPHGSPFKENSDEKPKPSDTAAPNPAISNLETKDKALATQIRIANYSLLASIPSQVILQSTTEEQRQRIDLKLNTILATLHPENTPIKGAGIENKLYIDIKEIVSKTPVEGNARSVEEDNIEKTYQVIKEKHLELTLNRIINVISLKLNPNIKELTKQGSLTQEQADLWQSTLQPIRRL